MKRRLLALCLTILATGCGGGSPAAPPPATTLPPPTTTLPPATLADLSAAVTSPEAGRKLSCRREVNVVVTLTNHAQVPVSASGVRKESRVTSGDCFPGGAYTYREGARVVGPGQTVTVMERPLYRGGSGCCSDPKNCGGVCGFEEELFVVTSLGEVRAGTVGYRLEFGPNCEKCSDSLQAAAADCAAPRKP